jgi:hypothetical protein
MSIYLCFMFSLFRFCADNLLQIIFAHKKHFKPEEYKQLEYILFEKSTHYLEVR